MKVLQLELRKMQFKINNDEQQINKITKQYESKSEQEIKDMERVF